MKKMLLNVAPKGAATKLALFGAVMVLSASQCTGPTVVVNQPTPTATPTQTVKPKTRTATGVDCKAYPNAPACVGQNRPKTGTTIQQPTNQTGVDCNSFPNAPACVGRTAQQPVTPTNPTTQTNAQSGAVRLVSNITGKCLSVLNGARGAGTSIVQNSCSTNRPDQLFIIRDLGGGITTLQNASTRLCATVDNNDQRDGVSMVQRPCNSNDPSQRFSSQDTDATGDRFLIKFGHSGKCIDVPDALPTENLQILQWQCDGSPQQVFQMSL